MRTRSEEGGEGGAERLDVGGGPILHGALEIVGRTELGEDFDGLLGLDSNGRNPIGEAIHDGADEAGGLLGLDGVFVLIDPAEKSETALDGFEALREKGENGVEDLRGGGRMVNP